MKKAYVVKLIAFLLASLMVLGVVPFGVVAETVADVLDDRGSDSIVILAGSDYQPVGSPGSYAPGEESVTMILTKMKEAGYRSLDGFLFVGDYVYGSHNVQADTAKGIDSLMNTVGAMYPEINHGNAILTQGNHDYADPRFDATGGHEFNGYSVYAINEDDYMDHGGTEAAARQLADDLSAYLNRKLDVGNNNPIFVLSHVPLAFGPRAYQNGDAKYASYIVDALNEGGRHGLNIIFLHGHDHSSGYDNYLGGEAIYLKKGDKIDICVPGSQRESYQVELQFTYMNAGYVGYYDDNNANFISRDTLTMTAFVIKNGEVTVERFNHRGPCNLKAQGRLSGKYANVDYVTPNLTVYPSPQTIALTPVEDKIILADEFTGVAAKAFGLQALNVGPYIVVPALDDPDQYIGHMGYQLDFELSDPSDIVTVRIPVPDSYPLALTRVFRVAGDGALVAVDAIITIIGGVKYAVIDGAVNGIYAVAHMVDNGNGYLNSWTKVSASRIYTLDTDHVLDEGMENRYLIVGYLKGSNNYNFAMSANGTNTRAVPVTIVNNTITLDTDAHEWSFLNRPATTGSADYPYLITHDGTNWAYHTNSNIYVTNASTGSTERSRGFWRLSTYHPTNLDAGTYCFRDLDGANWYLRYSMTGGKFTVKSGSSNPDDAYVRLFKLTSFGTVEGYVMLDGDIIQRVARGTSEAAAMEVVKAGITAYLADDAQGSNSRIISDDELTWSWVNGYDGNAYGYHPVSIKCGSTELGVVNVFVTPENDLQEYVEIEGDPIVTNVYQYTRVSSVSKNTSYVILPLAEAQALTLNGTDLTATPGTVNGTKLTSETPLTTWTLKTASDNTYYISNGDSNNKSFLAITNNALISSGTSTNGTWYVIQMTSGEFAVFQGGVTDRTFTYNYLTFENGAFVVKTAQLTGQNKTNDYTKTSKINSAGVERIRFFGDETIVSGQVPGPSSYVKAESGEMITLPVGTTLAEAQAAVLGNVTVWKSDTTDFAVKTDVTADATITIANFDGGVPGYYQATISYGGKELGTVPVCVANVPVSGYLITDAYGNPAQVGYVSMHAGMASKVQTSAGGDLFVTTVYLNGTTSHTPLTLSRLNQNGEIINTQSAGVLTGVSVVFDGFELDNNFTLVIRERVVNNYPNYPDEGSVTVDKTASSVDFQASGLADIQLSASGLPVKKGADVIVMLDTSSSMKDNYITAADGTRKTRAAVLEESFADLIRTLQQPGVDGTIPDVRMAVADFNGFYGNEGSNPKGGYPYDSDANDIMSDGKTYTAVSQAKVYTGSQDLTASAFARVEDLTANSWVFNYAAGTNYDYAFDAVYQLGHAIQQENAQRGEERDLFVIFMSDGAAMQWNYYHTVGSTATQTVTYTKDGVQVSETRNLWDCWLDGSMTEADMAQYLNCQNHAYYYGPDADGDGSYNDHRMATAIKGDVDRLYEVIRKSDAGLESVCAPVVGKDNMYTLPGLGATVFSIAYDALADKAVTTNAIRKSIKSLASASDLYYLVQSSDELSNAFGVIGDTIAYAATNARFIDSMGSEFDLSIKQVDYYVKDDGGLYVHVQGQEYRLATSEDGDAQRYTLKTHVPVIRVGTYDIYSQLNVSNGTALESQIGERIPNSYRVIETITFNENGTEAYSSLIDGGNTNILGADGIIRGSTVLYNTTNAPVIIQTAADGAYALPAETFYWNIGVINRQEIVLDYTVYLTGALEGERVEGSYPTNESATLYYTNYIGNPCFKDTVSPVLAWGAANVSYGFYLVNANGDPINIHGEHVSFANRVVVQSERLYSTVNLNSGDAINQIEVLARPLLGEHYELFDESAMYTVSINAVGSGDWSIRKGTEKATTIVTDYDGDNHSYALFENNGTYDYTHTTVWFAVLFNAKTLDDAVVIDYGAPVEVDAYGNDIFYGYGEIRGLSLDSSAYTMGGYTPNLDNTFGTEIRGKFGTFTITAEGKIRYTPETMNMYEPETIYYAVLFDGNQAYGYYYGKLTVIPATIMYFEDSFVTYKNSEVATEEFGKWSDPVQSDLIQSEDRVGISKNVYGYDPMNEGFTTFSAGTATSVTVDATTGARRLAENGEYICPTASFTFTGTGFDIISMTSSTTDLIQVIVTNAAGEEVVKKMVSNYYGYTYGPLYRVNEELNITNPMLDENGDQVYGFVPAADPSEAIWQVPVMKVEGLEYGTYDVTILVVYTTLFDTNKDNTSTFVLDSVRIYDPAKNNDEAELAYTADSEFAPSYQTLKDVILSPENLATEETINGVVFIDGKDATNSAADYANPGPNNETYLAYQQSVSFKLRTSSYDPTSIGVQIGAKLAFGETATLALGGETFLELNTATDMYYVLLNESDWHRAEDGSGWVTDVITLTNTTQGAVISLTNLKFTDIRGVYQASPMVTAVVDGEVMAQANAVMMSLFSAPVALEPVTKTETETETEPETEAETEDKGKGKGKDKAKDKASKEDKKASKDKKNG